MPGGSPAIVAAVFRAVRTGNAFEETVERLLTAIRLGVVAPGERFPAERDFAAQRSRKIVAKIYTDVRL